MKKVVSCLVLFGTCLGFSSAVHAEESAVTDLGFNVVPGELELAAARPIQFGEIQYSANSQTINPVINLHDYKSIFFDYVTGGSGMTDSYFSIVDIQDNRLSDNTWQLTASLAPLKNQQTGHEINDIKLHLNNPTDQMISAAPFQQWSTEQKKGIRLSNVTLKADGRTQEVALYSGEAGRGRHAVGYFTENELVENTNRIASLGPYKVNSIALEFPADMAIEEGSYSSAVTWTLTDTPGVHPIEVF